MSLIMEMSQILAVEMWAHEIFVFEWHTRLTLCAQARARQIFCSSILLTVLSFLLYSIYPDTIVTNFCTTWRLSPCHQKRQSHLPSGAIAPRHTRFSRKVCLMVQLTEHHETQGRAWSQPWLLEVFSRVIPFGFQPDESWVRGTCTGWR